MYQVSINGYRLAEVSHGKPYYVYSVELLESESGTRYFIERRYREFSALHRTLKKENADVAPFPPKKVRNLQPKVLEQRRVALELYIQKMLRLSATKQQVLNFLGVESQAPAGESYKGLYKNKEDSQPVQPDTLGHQPVLTFASDPYVRSAPMSNNHLPDIVINGVLLGIYTDREASPKVARSSKVKRS